MRESGVNYSNVKSNTSNQNTSVSPYKGVSAAKLAQMDKIEEQYDARIAAYAATQKKEEVFEEDTGSGFLTAVQPTPSTPTPIVIQPTVPPVKSATPQYILGDSQTVPIEVITDLIFENIGGHELIDIARHDTISGNFIPTQLIKNINKINQTYDPKNILNLQNTSDKYFASFPIKLNNKIPESGTGPDGSSVYLDDNGNIVIELINIEVEEQVELQMSTNGTIYEVVI